MADEQNQQGQDQAGATGSSAGTENTGFIPKARFDEVNNARRALEQQNAELLQKLNDADQQRLVETGNFKELAEKAQGTVKTLEPYKARTEALEAMIREGNDKRIALIPEAKRALIEPLRAELSPEKLAFYLDANWAYFQSPVAPDLDAGAGSGSGKPAVQVTEADRQAASAAAASGYKVTPEEIAALRRKKTT